MFGQIRFCYYAGDVWTFKLHGMHFINIELIKQKNKTKKKEGVGGEKCPTNNSGRRTIVVSCNHEAFLLCTHKVYCELLIVHYTCTDQ